MLNHLLSAFLLLWAFLNQSLLTTFLLILSPLLCAFLLLWAVLIQSLNTYDAKLSLVCLPLPVGLSGIILMQIISNNIEKTIIGKINQRINEKLNDTRYSSSKDHKET